MKKIFLLSLLSLSVIASELIVTGTVVSNNQKMIGARYMGYVKKINFEIGASVKREDTLFELESAEFDILKNQADLALEQSKIMLDMYQTRMDAIKRERRLLKKNNVNDFTEQMEDMQIATDNASAGIAATQALLKDATAKVKQVATISDYLEVKAPNDGIIVQKGIQVGDLIVPGMLAMIIVDLDHLEIEAEVAESDLFYINTNQGVKIEIPALRYKDIGIVKSIVPNANPMAHTFKIRISFNQGNRKIFPGMYAKIFIEVGTRRDKL